jgi:hypothetical protein
MILGVAEVIFSMTTILQQEATMTLFQNVKIAICKKTPFRLPMTVSTFYQVNYVLLLYPCKHKYVKGDNPKFAY